MRGVKGCDTAQKGDGDVAFVGGLLHMRLARPIG